MRQILIQSSLKRRQEQEEQLSSKVRPSVKKPDFKNIDSVHGGHKDRSGFIVFLVLAISSVIALAMS
jgi:hypothetical protein